MSKEYEIRYAYNTLVYAGESIVTSIERLARYGYDGVEIVGEPEKMDIDEIIKSLRENSISASSILGIYTMERDLVSSNPDTRENTVEYIKQCAKVANEVGAEIVTVAPTACTKIYAEDSIEQEWEWAVKGLQEAGKYAADFNVKLVVESWNRYETYLINRLEQSVELIKRVGLPNVGSMCDTFHMNIEDENIPESIKEAGSFLMHVHFADSNRKAPGYGHIDFVPIAQAIKDIGYKGYLSMELLPAAADPFLVLNGSRQDEFYDQYTKDSIEFLKPLF
jgi:sugar phosphate isomerase/epimerase